MKPDSSITNPDPEPTKVAEDPNSGITYEPVVSIRTVAARTTAAPADTTDPADVDDGGFATRIVADDPPPPDEQPTNNTTGNKPGISLRQHNMIWPLSGDTRNSAPT